MTDTEIGSHYADRGSTTTMNGNSNGKMDSFKTASTPSKTIESQRPVVVSSSVVTANTNSALSLSPPPGLASMASVSPSGTNGTTASSYQHQTQLSPHITTTTPFPSNRSSEIYSIAVSSLPPSMHWRQVRDLVQTSLPDAHIIFTKLLGPGFGIIRVKGHANAMAVTHHLNGLVLPPGYVVAATCAKEDQQAQTQAHQSQLELQLQMQQFQNHYQQQQNQIQRNHHSPDLSGSNSSTPSSPANMFVSVQNPYYYTGQTAYMNPSAEYWPTSYYSSHQYMRRHKGLKQRIFTEKQRLFIGNIPYETQWQDLKDFLRAGGNIYRVDIPEIDGQQKGYAIAIYHSEEDAAKAIDMFNRATFNGRELFVRYDRVTGPESGTGHSRTPSEE